MIGSSAVCGILDTGTKLGYLKVRKGIWLLTALSLAVLGGIAGFAATSSYFGVVGAREGFTAACHALRVGEARNLISAAQRGEIAALTVTEGKGDGQLFAYLKSDCSIAGWR